MQITTFLHAAILVTDLDRAQHFYSTVLGLPQVDRPLKFPGIWYQVGEFQIHLIATSTVAANKANTETWGRDRHLAFAIKDLDAVNAHWFSQNYPFQMSTSGRAALFVQDPDNNVIELNQS